jgi:hypothetical protein
VTGVDGGEADVDVGVDARGAVVLWLLEQAGANIRAASSATETAAIGRRGNVAPM